MSAVIDRRLCRKEILRGQLLKLFKTLTARLSVIKSKNSQTFIKHCCSYFNAGYKQHDNEETNLASNQRLQLQVLCLLTLFSVSVFSGHNIVIYFM